MRHIDPRHGVVADQRELSSGGCVGRRPTQSERGRRAAVAARVDHLHFAILSHRPSDTALPPLDRWRFNTREADSTSSPVTELTVVVPTYNERGNVEVLADRLRAALDGVAWRAIFVDDDSPDGTTAAVKAMAEVDDRIQCLRRVGRRGLAGAVIEGVLASASPFVAVIDGDLQHDETLLPRMLCSLRSGEADLAIGTRFGSADGLSVGLSPIRRLGSRAASWAGRRVLRTKISDPVSGFFMIRRDLVERVAPTLSPDGFKILFDIVSSQAAPPRISEFPYAFAERVSGVSKLDSRVVVDYAGLLIAKSMGGIVSARAVIFVLGSAIGVSAQMVVLAVLIGVGSSFGLAQGLAALAIVAASFGADFALTRVASARALTWAFLGVLANLAVGELVYRHHPDWGVAGMAGAAMGALWTHASRER